MCWSTPVSRSVSQSQVSNIFTMSQSRLVSTKSEMSRLVSCLDTSICLGHVSDSEKNVLTPSLSHGPNLLCISMTLACDCLIWHDCFRMVLKFWSWFKTQISTFGLGLERHSNRLSSSSSFDCDNWQLASAFYTVIRFAKWKTIISAFFTCFAFLSSVNRIIYSYWCFFSHFTCRNLYKSL